MALSVLRARSAIDSQKVMELLVLLSLRSRGRHQSHPPPHPGKHHEVQKVGNTEHEEYQADLCAHNLDRSTHILQSDAGADSNRHRHEADTDQVKAHQDQVIY